VIGANFLTAYLCLVASVLGTAVPAFAGNNLYTTYTFNGPNAVDLMTCGSAGNTQGCFGSASLTGLSGVCLLLVGPETVGAYRARQRVYLLQTGTDAAPFVTLKIYNKFVTVKTVTVGQSQQTNVTTTVSPPKAVRLPVLTGGANSTCTMVANASSLFISTSASTATVRVDTTKLVSHTVATGRVRAMTVDENGNVIVNMGASERTFGPNGEEIGGGGIANPLVFPNQTVGVPLD